MLKWVGRGFRGGLRALRRFLFAVVAAQVTLVLMLVAAATAVVSYVYLPLPVASLPPERPPPGRASTVYAFDGTPIGEFRGAEQQVPVAAADIPDTIRRAVVAAEDHRFFVHRGVDWRGLLRAVEADVRSGEFSRGGSTLTQQLVKNVYTGSRRSLGRKLREALPGQRAGRR
jgi:membrane peptidoglycan carboxypeptidase